MTATLTSALSFSADRDALYQAISHVQRATAARPVQPILSNVYLEAQSSGVLVLAATDMDFSVRTEMPALVTGEGAVTVSAKKLSEILSKLPSGQTVSIALKPDDNLVHVQCGSSAFDIRTMAAEDFPSIPLVNEAPSIQVDLASMVQAISQTAFAAASYETNNILGGVFFKLTPGMLEMAATDGSRLARALEATSSSLQGDEISAVIPVRAISEVVKLLSGSVTEGQTVGLNIAQGLISFRTDSVYVVSRLLDGQYPQYQKLIPTENTIVAYANRKELISSLERAAVMANERTHVVKMSFDGSELTLAANTPDLGDSKDTLSVEFNGIEPLQIAFNYKFLLDALKVMSTDDIKMETNGPLAPTLFSARDQNNTLCLVMPVQVK